MIFLLIALFILIYALRNFQKAALLMFVYKLVLVQNITVVSIPGIPLLTVSTFLLLGFGLIYLYKRQKLKLENSPFPYLRPMRFLVISMFLSTIFAIAGFNTAISAFLLDFLNNIFSAFLAWKCINSKEDINFILRTFTICFFIFGVYDVWEHFAEVNPVVEFETTLNSDESRTIEFTYLDADERGYRAQSVFEHAIGAGINFCLYACLVLVLKVKYNFDIPLFKMSIVVVILCFCGIAFSASRGPILFALVCFIPLINFRSRKLYYFLCVLIPVFYLIWKYYPTFYLNLYSIFDTHAAEKVGGSNAEMRLSQFDSAFEIMKRSPIVGNGYKFLSYLNSAQTVALLGMESMWFRIMTQFGVLGVCTNIYYAYYSLFKIRNKCKLDSVFFVTLAYWIVGSLTSTPGMLMYFYFIVLIIFIKLSPEYTLKQI